MTKKEPKTKLTANMSFLLRELFFPGMNGKFKVDSEFPFE
jgi:hypothetical protein